MKEEKEEPPEMAVFSFIDLPDVLTEIKGEHIMTKKKKKPYNQKAIQEIFRKRGITPAPLDDPIYNEPVTITFTNRRWIDPDSEEGKGS